MNLQRIPCLRGPLRPFLQGLFVLSLVTACSKSEKPPPAADPLPSAPVSSAASPAKRAGTMTTADGLVTVHRPEGKGWRCKEQSRMKSGYQVSMLQCRRTGSDEHFVLIAKDYTVSAMQVMPAKKLCDDEYRRHYERTYKKMEVRISEPSTHRGSMAHELRFDAQDPAHGEIQKVERVMVKGTHVMVLSAEGKTADFNKRHADTDKWFDKAAFKTLGQKWKINPSYP